MEATCAFIRTDTACVTLLAAWLTEAAYINCARRASRGTKSLVEKQFGKCKYVTILRTGIAQIGRLRASAAHRAAFEADALYAELAFTALILALTIVSREAIIANGTVVTAQATLSTIISATR